MTDIIAFTNARLDEDEERWRKMLADAQRVSLEVQEPELLGRRIPGWYLWRDVAVLCEEALRGIAGSRHVVALHTDQHECAGWPAAYDYPFPGCQTVRLIAVRWDGCPDYDPAWRPE